MSSIKKIFANLAAVFKWLKSVASEQDGTGSASRVVKLVVVGSSAFCLVYVTLKTGQLPSADQLKSLGFVIGTGSAAYAANQLKEMLSKDKDAS